MYQKTVTIHHGSILQDSIVSHFIQLANQFKSDIYLSAYLGGTARNAKDASALAHMNMRPGQSVVLYADGCDAQQAVESLACVLEQPTCPSSHGLGVDVALTSNAGVRLKIGGVSIWVDALHHDQAHGFSTLSPEQFSGLQQTCTGPDLMVFTHCHQDHYSQCYVEQALQTWPNMALLSPEPHIPGQILIQGKSMKYAFHGVTLEFQRLTHEGARFAHVPLYGIRISHQDTHILIPGDSQSAAQEVVQWAMQTPVDLALLNFPWLTLHRGQKYLHDIAPRHTIIYHLPFEQDDCCGYRTKAEHAASRMCGGTDLQLLYNSGQQLHY